MACYRWKLECDDGKGEMELTDEISHWESVSSKWSALDADEPIDSDLGLTAGEAATEAWDRVLECIEQIVPVISLFVQVDLNPPAYVVVGGYAKWDDRGYGRSVTAIAREQCVSRQLVTPDDVTKHPFPSRNAMHKAICTAQHAAWLECRRLSLDPPEEWH